MLTNQQTDTTLNKKSKLRECMICPKLGKICTHSIRQPSINSSHQLEDKNQLGKSQSRKLTLFSMDNSNMKKSRIYLSQKNKFTYSSQKQLALKKSNSQRLKSEAVHCLRPITQTFLCSPQIKPIEMNKQNDFQYQENQRLQILRESLRKVQAINQPLHPKQLYKLIQQQKKYRLSRKLVLGSR